MRNRIPVLPGQEFEDRDGSKKTETFLEKKDEDEDDKKNGDPARHEDGGLDQKFVRTFSRHSDFYCVSGTKSIAPTISCPAGLRTKSMKAFTLPSGSLVM